MHVSIGVSGSQEKWVDSLKRVARFVKVESGHLTVTFDEIGVLSFGFKIPSVLATAGFQSFSLDVLMTFCSGLTDMFQNLQRPQPPTLTGKEYEILARILLGFQAVVIFGVKAITPSITQAVVYTPYYVDKALADIEKLDFRSPWNIFLMQPWRQHTSDPKKEISFLAVGGMAAQMLFNTKHVS